MTLTPYAHAWRILISSIVPEGELLPHSRVDITLGQHERCHLLAVPPTTHPVQAGQARRWSLCHRRKPTSKTATHHPQQITPKSAQSSHPRSRLTRLPIPIFESQARLRRDVEELLAARGIIVTYESIRLGSVGRVSAECVQFTFQGHCSRLK